MNNKGDNKKNEKISDLIEKEEANLFVTRTGYITKIEEAIKNTKTPFINIWGVGGFGKTSLLKRTFANFYKDAVCFGFDFHANQDKNQLHILGELRNQIPKMYSKYFVKFDNVIKTLEKIKGVIVKNSQQQSPNLTDIATVGSSVLGAIPVVGSPLGAAVSLSTIYSGWLNKRKQFKPIPGLNKKDTDLLFNLEDQLTETFVEALNDIPKKLGKLLMISFDTYESVPLYIDDWLRTKLFDRLTIEIKIFIVGREKLSSSADWSRYSSFIEPCEIGLFTESDAKEYICKRVGEYTQTLKIDKLCEEDVKTIIEFTGCIPWALWLVFHYAIPIKDMKDTKTSNNDIGERVVERVLNHIGQDDKEHIYLCSTLRSFNFAVLKYLDKNITKDTYDKIRCYSITENLGLNKYAIHKAVSQYIRNYFKTYHETEFISMSNKIIEYYTTKLFDEESACIEILFHNLTINETMGLQYCEKLLSVDSLNFVITNTLLNEISKYDFISEIGKKWRDVAKMRLQMNIGKGKWEEVKEVFKKNLSNSNSQHFNELVQGWLSEIYVGCGEYTDAIKTLKHVISKSYVNWQIVSRLCECYGIVGQYPEGEKLALEKISICRKNCDKTGLAWLLKSLGDIYRLWGKSKDAVSHLEESVELFKERKDTYGEAVALTQLARVYTHIGEWDKADNCLIHADTLYSECQFQYGQANCLLFQGNILRMKSQWEKALIVYDKALNIHNEMSSEREIGPLLGSIGLVYSKLIKNGGSKFTEQDVKEKFESSLNMKTRQQYMRGVMVTKNYMGDHALLNNNIPLASKCYKEVLELQKNGVTYYIKNYAQVGIFKCNCLLKKTNLECDINVEYDKLIKELSTHNFGDLLATVYYVYAKYIGEKNEKYSHVKGLCLDAAQKYNLYLYNSYVGLFSDV
ncbi:MAG: tetratricopeptide repeat protein [Firmicutes bacterium]|nr:tetratricopeptide repeat protein [Bacillota bacterium]